VSDGLDLDDEVRSAGIEAPDEGEEAVGKNDAGRASPGSFLLPHWDKVRGNLNRTVRAECSHLIAEALIQAAAARLFGILGRRPPRA
jgi:hypothetical protein